MLVLIYAQTTADNHYHVMPSTLRATTLCQGGYDKKHDIHSH